MTLFRILNVIRPPAHISAMQNVATSNTAGSELLLQGVLTFLRDHILFFLAWLLLIFDKPWRIDTET